MVRAMVLAAGLGTRLRPLSVERPKALVPVGDRPLAWHIVDRLSRAGFDEVVMNTHHLAGLFPLEIESFTARVHLIHEEEIRGTAGGIAGARSLFGPPPVIAWNTDILADPPVAELLEAASRGGICFAVAPRPVSEGTVGIGANGCLVRLRGKTFGTETSGGDYIGVAALGAEVLEALPERGCLVGDVALPRLARGEPVLTVRADGAWRDVGTIAEYLAANLDWLRSACGDGGSWVHPTATVEDGVRLSRSVVGAHAVVSGSGLVENTVVWPRARVIAPVSGAVVTTSGVVIRQ
jgi:mannose-1-phosphate guanylyltransferase